MAFEADAHETSRAIEPTGTSEDHLESTDGATKEPQAPSDATIEKSQTQGQTDMTERKSDPDTGRMGGYGPDSYDTIDQAIVESNDQANKDFSESEEERQKGSIQEDSDKKGQDQGGRDSDQCANGSKGDGDQILNDQTLNDQRLNDQRLNDQRLNDQRLNDHETQHFGKEFETHSKGNTKEILGSEKLKENDKDTQDLNDKHSNENLNDNLNDKHSNENINDKHSDDHDLHANSLTSDTKHYANPVHSYQRTPTRRTKFSLESPEQEKEREDDRDKRDDEQDEDPFDFRKKDPRRSRTQSFQSVLSTASLKSLKQSAVQQSAQSEGTVDTNKNFQSFIQAPVLSSIAKNDRVEIGQQLPFNDKSSSSKSDEDSEEYDDDTILQQQKLTLNALKKLSLSPMIMNDDELKPVRKASVSKNKDKEPYQPAEVDLSSFASLTRQPKHVEAEKPFSGSTTPVPARTNSLSHLNLNDQKTRRNPVANGAVVPPQNMINRRSSGQQPQPQQGFPLPHQPQPQYQAFPPASRQTKQLQQIKGLRSPMYVPAVLRKTTRNGVSPVHSETASPEIVNNLHSLSNPNDMSQSTSRTSINSFESQDSAVTYKYEDSSRAPPTRRHWLKDENVFKCGIRTCSRVFNFFERRHHCRKCGGIYCKEHTSHYLYINHLAQFTTGGRGTLSKVCDRCIEDYHRFINEEFGTAKQVEQVETRIPRKSVESEPLAGSVPANWSWSSF